MKEIGGYFGFEKFEGREYYGELIALNSARNALLYLIKARKIKKLYIPYFMCDSVSNLCDRCSCEYEYYHIDRKFRPIFSGELSPDEYLYIVNYYGQLKKEEIKSFKSKYVNIILDNVQAFFQIPIEGIDTIYSCRKFFGVPDGAYLSTDARIDCEVPRGYAGDHMTHLLGRFEYNASAYYSVFKEEEMRFETLELAEMSKISKNILSAVSYDEVIDKRNRNYKFLDSALKDRNLLNFDFNEGPYSYPFYTENGIEIKRKLAEKKIFIPTLWPNVLDFEGCDWEKSLAQNILPLPIDQRYGSEDMNFMLNEVIKCIN